MLNVQSGYVIVSPTDICCHNFVLIVLPLASLASAINAVVLQSLTVPPVIYITAIRVLPTVIFPLCTSIPSEKNLTLTVCSTEQSPTFISDDENVAAGSFTVKVALFYHI